jgi:DNA-binding protein Fis
MPSNEKNKTTQNIRNGFQQVTKEYLVDFFEEHPDILTARGIYPIIMGEVEKPLISCVLKFTKGNQSIAAEILGVNRNTLRKKIIDLKLNLKDFRG